MPTKVTIIERIGEQKLILPILVTRALAAHARLTYYLMLVQTAYARAIAPDEQAPSLRVEREASGVTDSSFDRIVAGSSMIGSNTLHMPQAESIVEQLFDELRLMLPPLEIASLTRPEVHARFDIYQRRFNDLVAHMPVCHEDQLTVGAIAVLTGCQQTATTPRISWRSTSTASSIVCSRTLSRRPSTGHACLASPQPIGRSCGRS